MDAKNYQLKTILDGTHQYVVPIYQREYSWRKAQWDQLWTDIVGLDIDSVEDHHFLGSIVSKSFDAKAGGLTKYLLIDGQQRLTTITLLLAALRDLLKSSAEENATQTANMIHELYLTNRFRSGDEVYKLLPTKTDRGGYFQHILPTESVINSDSRIGEAYRFFRKAIQDALADDSTLSLQKLQSTITDRMELVSITLGSDDNDYRIFESLNATGMPLTQTDLLRNFFLMRIEDLVQQERIYHELVRPITSDIDAVTGASSDTLFQYALQRTGVYVRDKDVYVKWKRATEHQPVAELEHTLSEIHRDSGNYLKLIEPSRESNENVAEEIRRFRMFGVITPTPFLLNAFRWREDGKVDDEGLVSIIQLVESFVVRRMFAGVPNNALNRIFIRLAEQMPESHDLVEATHRALSAAGLRWPNDAQFEETFVTYPLYADSRPSQRQLVLQALEKSFGHKEFPATLNATVEHIMPQSLTAEWSEALGENARQMHQKYLHTVGNLTLSGYNSELGNMPFSQKKVHYANSNFSLNKMIAAYDHWDAGTIVDRAQNLLERAKAIWVAPIAVD